MNINSEFFSQAGKRWSEEEDKLLCDRFRSGLDLVDLCKIHRRFPKSIIIRLVDIHKLVSEPYLIKGYGSSEYENLLKLKSQFYEKKKKIKSEISEEVSSQNILNYKNFERDNDIWTNDEDKLLIERYKSNMDLVELCKCHQRFPNSIICRIIDTHKLVDDPRDISGYETYEYYQLLKIKNMNKNLVISISLDMDNLIKEYITQQVHIEEEKKIIKKYEENIKKYKQLEKTIKDKFTTFNITKWNLKDERIEVRMTTEIITSQRLNYRLIPEDIRQQFTQEKTVEKRTLIIENV